MMKTKYFYSVFDVRQQGLDKDIVIIGPKKIICSNRDHDKCCNGIIYWIASWHVLQVQNNLKGSLKEIIADERLLRYVLRFSSKRGMFLW